MLFSKDSLYGWGVYKVPMPRSATDLFTDRRRRSWKIGFPDRRGRSRSPGFWACIGSICRDDVPWRVIAVIIGLAMLFLAMMSWIAASLPGELKQPETLPIEIVVALRKEPSPVLIPEQVTVPEPVAQVVEVPPEAETKVAVPPPPKPVAAPVVKVEPKPVPQPKVEKKEVPRVQVVERVMTPPKKEIVVTPPPVKKSYRAPEKRVETVPEKQVALKQPRQEQLLPTKSPATRKFTERTQQAEALRESSRTLDVAPQVALQGPALRNDRLQTERPLNSDRLPQAVTPSMTQKNDAVVKPRTSFTGYATDNRAEQEKVSIATRTPAIAPSNDGTKVERAPTAVRTYDRKRDDIDQLAAPESITVFATQNNQPVKLAGAGKISRITAPDVVADEGLPSSNQQVFQAASNAQENIVLARGESGKDKVIDRPILDTGTVSGAAPVFDPAELASIDQSQFVSLSGMQACLDPKEDGRLLTKLALLLQQDGRCSNGQVAFDVRSPQDGYSIHVQMYNPGGVQFTDKCMALNQAIECFDSN